MKLYLNWLYNFGCVVTCLAGRSLQASITQNQITLNLCAIFEQSNCSDTNLSYIQK